jgi:hypothetical protein
MNCLRSLERWDRWFQSHPSYECLYVRYSMFVLFSPYAAALLLLITRPRSLYRLCKIDKENEGEARAQQKTVEPLTNE